MDFASLRRVWEQAFGAAPPRSLSARFHAPRSCVRTPVPDPWLAFGHNPARSGCHGERDTKAPALPQSPFLPGTHLVREWNGRTYQVEVIDNGYRFDGKTYPSLTTIAKRITGTHWSGTTLFRPDAQAQGLT